MRAGARLGRRTALGADVEADLPDAGLNPALEHGVALLRERDGGMGVATVSGDLPCLRAQDLTAALLLTAERSFVADSAGSGTTLLAAVAGVALRPAYGPGSAALHRCSGARELDVAPGLRRDVDTPADLAEAVALGVGVSTAAVAAGLDLAAAGCSSGGARSPRQGTMHR